MGLLANGDPDGTIRIVGSEFADTLGGSGDGLRHNLYVGNIASLVINDSYFHDAYGGHQIKSRAQSTTITDSRIYDGSGAGSYGIDLPNGGVGIIHNNVIQQGPNSDNPGIIHYGDESDAYAGSSLLIEDNVVVNDMSSSGARLLYNNTTVTSTIRDNAVYGLTAGQIALGSATVSGTTFLATHPTLDTSSGGGGGGGGSPSGPTMPIESRARQTWTARPTGSSCMTAPAAGRPSSTPIQTLSPASSGPGRRSGRKRPPTATRWRGRTVRQTSM